MISSVSSGNTAITNLALFCCSKVETALVNAYSTVLKYSVKNGLHSLTVKQFEDSLDAQIDDNVYETLKTEEWLLEAVGLGTLRNNNLLPTREQPVMVKDIHEAFLRFDDKPLIGNQEAVRKSLLKYCAEGAFGIAFGDGKEFTNYYLEENAPFFDIGDTNYWLVDKRLKPGEPETSCGGMRFPPIDKPIGTTAGGNESPPISPVIEKAKQFKSITVSGKVALEHFHELFGCFIAPFAPNGNKVEIQVNFKIASTADYPLTESKQQYKNAKEAAKQLGLNFENEKM